MRLHGLSLCLPLTSHSFVIIGQLKRKTEANMAPRISLVPSSFGESLFLCTQNESPFSLFRCE